eukprot:GFUD01096524.1.p1 GENE.GFUD01096524.1~~GFUD01096524.1.p1  ORF type:complete len:157 (-),score=67.04 GFUD01096524.1:7-477(-)
MSLALLKKELDLASSDLKTTDDTKDKSKQDKPMRAQLGTERHGIKKKMRKMKAKNNKKEGKISFKFSQEHNSKDKDFTGETLKLLAKLDSLATVSSAKIVEHNFARKRQQKNEAAEKKQKAGHDSLLFTDEDIQKMSKEYFLHSKTVNPKYDLWKE